MIVHADAGNKPACNKRGLVYLTIYSSKVTCTLCKRVMK